MHLALVLLASTTTTTKPSTTAGGSSATGLIFIVVIGLAAYFLFIRPRSAAQRRQRETLQELVAGDEVLTGAGIFGTVLDVASDRVTIETAPGTRITVLRSAIARRITPETEAPDDDWSSSADASPHEDEAHGAGPLGWSNVEDADGHNGAQGATPDGGRGEEEQEGESRP